MDYVMDETSSEEDAAGVLLSSEHSDDGETDHLEAEGEDDRNETHNVSMVDTPRVRPQEFDITEVYDVSAIDNIRSSTPELPPASVICINPSSQAALAETIGGPSRNYSDVKHSSQSRSRADNSVDDDGQTCTICFEPWTNTSEHRLISLRCGHLFGRSCITRWLKGQNSRCPQCNARARKSEIRNIYAKTVKVMDSTERDKALQDLQKESEKRRKAEMEAAHERLKHMMKVQECEMLKKKLMEANKLLQEYRCNAKLIEKTQSVKKNSSVFFLEKSIEIARNGSCRIVDVCDLLGIIVVSQQSTNELFPGYGFRKISTTELKPSEFVLIHHKTIKDIAFHCHDGLVLTASLDRTVKITNVLTNSVVQTYAVDSDAWSCAWDADNPLYFYSGAKSGDVYLYDIRVTNRYVQELPRFGCRTPVVAVQYIHKTCSRLSKSGPIVGKLSDCGFLQKSNQEMEYSAVPIPTPGPLASLSSEPVSGHFLISCRPSQCQPRLSHTLCELVSDPSGQDVLCNPVQSVQGGRNQVQLTRSKLLPHPDDASSLLICAGDEDAHGALIWDGSSGKSLDHLRTDSPVLDFAELKVNHKSVLMALTDSTLRLYSWSNQ